MPTKPAVHKPTNKAPPAGKKSLPAAKATPQIDSRDPTGHFSFEFERIDKNKDGWLSPSELHHGLLSAGWEQDEVCGLFDLIDTNKDGKITKEEFISYRAAQKSKDMALDPKDVFSSLDEDKDGGLNLKELAALIKTINEREGFLYDHEVGSYIKSELQSADKDGDKKLNLEEFLPWYDKFIQHVENFREEHEKKKQMQRGGGAAAVGKPAAAAGSFSGEGLWVCSLPNMPEALNSAWAKGKTPLLIDSTQSERDAAGTSPLDTFLIYGGGAGSTGYELLEMKRMVVEVNMTKIKTLEEHLELARKKLVLAMKHGRVLAVLLANSCPPLRTKFTAPDSLPLEIFDAEKVQAVRGLARWDGLWPEKVIRKEDDCQVIRDEFSVLVATKFRAEDYAEFLGDEAPLALMQPVHLTV